VAKTKFGEFFSVLKTLSTNGKQIAKLNKNLMLRI
jgi:hypothetical protein